MVTSATPMRYVYADDAIYFRFRRFRRHDVCRLRFFDSLMPLICHYVTYAAAGIRRSFVLPVIK